MTSISFYGSSSYSLIILKKLLTLSDFHLSPIITKEDKPFGRDKLITPNPVAAFAKDNNLPLLQISEFTPEVKEKLKKAASQLALCVAFGPPFFDQETIDIYPQKIINIHPSDLPKYRGATPGPWQIIKGETTSKVSFFQIDTLPDHGPIIKKLPLTISPSDTAHDFYLKAFNLAADNLDSILKQYIKDPDSMLTPQDHSQKTYFPKLDKDSALIDWSQNPDYLHRFILALNPWPIAWTYVTNQKNETLKMKIFSSKLSDQKITPDLVQIEGKNKVSWDQIKDHYQLKQP